MFKIEHDERYPEPDEETKEKLYLSQIQAEGKNTRKVKCPVCGFTLFAIPEDQKFVIYIKCRKCKYNGPLSTAYFRRIRSYAHMSTKKK